jgi:hypothetical protein
MIESVKTGPSFPLLLSVPVRVEFNNPFSNGKGLGGKGHAASDLDNFLGEVRKAE